METTLQPLIEQTIQRNLKHHKKIVDLTIKEDNRFSNALIEESRAQIFKAYAYPAEPLDAELHDNASKFGYNELSSKVQLCPCCKLPMNTQLIDLCCSTTPDVSLDKLPSTYQLTVGTGMYFTFVKMAICYLLMHALLSDVFNLVTNIQGYSCRTQQGICGTGVLVSLSALNKIAQQKLVYWLDLLNLLTIILSIVFFIGYRKVQFKIYNLIQSSQQTPDDYTLLIENIPIHISSSNQSSDFSYVKQLVEIIQIKINQWIQFNVQGNNNNPEPFEKDLFTWKKNVNLKEHQKVKCVTLCFDISEMQKLQFLKVRLMDRHINYRSDIEKTDESDQTKITSKMTQIITYIKDLNEQEIQLGMKFAIDRSVSFNMTHFVGKAFVSLEYKHYRDFILHEVNNHSDFLVLEGRSLRISKACCPNDIFWANLSIDRWTRLKSVIFSYLILLMLLTFAFAAVLLIQIIKQQLNSEQDHWTKFILTTAVSLVTIVVNFSLQKAIIKLTQIQCHKTRTDHLTSLIIKLVISQFINTALIYYIVSLIVTTPYLGSNGIVGQVSDLFITSGIILIFLNLLYPSDILHLLKKYYYQRKPIINMFQIQLNEIYEKPHFEIAERYSYYIVQIFTASFYAYLAPIGILFLTVTFAVQYWVDKINLFRRSSALYDVDFVLSRNAIKLFESSLFVFAAGNFLFSMVMHHKYVNWVNVMGLVIAFVYVLVIVFMPTKIEKYFMDKEGYFPEHVTYSRCIKDKKFRQNYWTSNPATKFVKEIDPYTGKPNIADQMHERLHPKKIQRKLSV